MSAIALSELCELITDGTHYTPPDIGAGVPFLTVRDMSGSGLDFEACSHISHEEYLKAKAQNSAPHRGDILFSKDGTVGKVHVVKDEPDFAVLSSIAILRPDPSKIDAAFAAHYLRSPEALAAAAQRKTGSALTRIILKDLKQLRLPLIGIEEQKRIAAILDQVDELRRKRKRTIDRLNKLSQSIFHEMFAGDAAQQYEIGELIADGSIVVHKDGNHGSQYPRKEEFGEIGIPFVSAAAIDNFGQIINRQIQYLSVAKARTLTIGWIQEGDVLLSHNASVGKVALYDGSLGSALIGTSLTCFRVNSNAFTPYFLFLALKSENFQKQLVSNMSQTTRNQVPITAQRRLRIPRPSLEIQKKLAEKIELVTAHTARLSVAKYDLDKLFRSLQHRAFQGQL